MSTLVLGAGPAGLAVAACLGLANQPYTLLEKASRVGSTWRSHYDRLHLHTIRRHSNLPHRVMPGNWPQYPSRDQLIQYLEDYAAHFGIEPRFDIAAKRVEQTDNGWRLHTQRGAFEGRQLVMATGYNRVPRIPSFPGLAAFAGPVLHSAQYKNGSSFSGKNVLVVGCGNSGAEIALDLCEHGANVAMVVRGPTYVTPRDLLGRPSQQTSIMMSRLPMWLADSLSRVTLRVAVGDLSEWGIQRPALGPLRMIQERGRVPILDVGTLDKIKSGHILVVPGVARIHPDHVDFEDGQSMLFDGIILATGYTSGLPSLFPDHPQLFNDRGLPGRFGEAALPGLYFVGFRNPSTGGLREITLEAQRAVDDISRPTARGRTSA